MEDCAWRGFALEAEEYPLFFDSTDIAEEFTTLVEEKGSFEVCLICDACAIPEPGIRMAEDAGLTLLGTRTAPEDARFVFCRRRVHISVQSVNCRPCGEYVQDRGCLIDAQDGNERDPVRVELKRRV